jgi:cell division protein FtsB
MTSDIKDKTLLSCWPDGFSRYYSVSRILRATFGKKMINVLDVGGDSKWMYEFLNDAGLYFNLHIVDTRLPDFKNPNIKYTKADFFKLDPKDYEADAVINTDVLEHIPQNLKVPFVKKCVEFTQSVAVFSAPQEDDEVTFSEHTIDDLTKKATGKQQRWLKEHFEFGKPNPEVIEETIKKLGYPYMIINTNNLDNWLLSFSANLVNQSISVIPNMDELNQLYNANIVSVGDFAGKPYRKIFVVFKDRKIYQEVEPKIQKIFTKDTSNQLKFNNEVVKALVTKILVSDRQIEKLNKQLAESRKNTLQREEQIKNLEGELQKIFAKGWFKYINKADSVVRRKK